MSVRRAVCISQKNHFHVEQYAVAMGLSREQAMDEALDEWWTLFGESRERAAKNAKPPRDAKVFTMAARIVGNSV